MPTRIEPFHERGFRIACKVVRLYANLARLPSVPPLLARQVLKAGTSIGANLEEGRAAQSRRDVTAKFSIALKEARETVYWLRLLQATDLVPPSVVADLLEESGEMIAVLTTARRKLSANG